MAKVTRVIPLVIFLVITAFLWRGLAQNPRNIPSPLIGKPVPAFRLNLLNNSRTIVTQRQLLGKVALINVWASWCSYCQVEHPVLMDIAHSRLVPVYGLNYRDQRKPALNWLRRFGNPYKMVLYDPRGDLGINLGVYGTPETFLIDQQGIIRYKYVGPLTETAWQRVLLPRVQKLIERGN